MRKTMKKLTQGATRLLVLALGLGLTATGWGAVPTPTAVWEAGQFEDVASLHGGYSISLNGNSVVNDKIVISSNATKGVTIDIEGVLGNTSGRDVSVLIKYSGAKAPASQAVFVCNYSYKDSGKFDTGLASKEASSGALKGYWNTTANYPMKTNGADVYPTVTDNSGAGYLLFSYKHQTENGITKGVYGYNGSSVATMTGGSNDGLCWPGRYLSKVAIGGPSGEVSSYGVWPDLVIEGIAIFVDKTYTNSDLAAYVFPSDYDYVATISANTSLSDITTWTKGSGTPGTGSKVCINTENGAVLTVSGTLDYEVLHVLGDGSITLANGANISSTIISGVDMNIAASTEVTVSNSSILNKIGCNGKLITNGDVKLLDSGNNFAYGSEISVVTGTTTVNAHFAAYNSAGRGLHGNITIAKGAKFVNSRTEVFDCNADANHPIVVDVSGTLSLGSTRWTLGNNNKIVLHEGGRVEGDGDSSSNGAFDLENNVTGFTIEADGNAEFAALVRIRDTATLNVDVAAGKTLTFSTKGFVATTGKLIKTGDGTLANTINSSYTGLTTVSAGKIVSTAFPAGNVSIASGATYTLKNLGWTDQPSRFSGEGTLELFNDRAFNGSTPQHCTHTVTGVTFPGTIKFTATNAGTYGCGHLISNVGFISSEVRPQLELNTLTGVYSKLFFNTVYNNQTIAVRDLKGSGHLSAKASGGTAQNQTLETKQTQNTVFSGNLVTDDTPNKDAEHKTNLHVIGDDSGTVKTLTLSGANTSVGELSVSNGAKVSFASTGSWASGTVTVGNGGWLESTNSSVMTSLTLTDGANIVFPTASSSLTGITSLTFASGTATISIPEDVKHANGTLIDWSAVGAAPTGTFQLNSDAARKYFISADASGLSITAAAARIGDTPYTDVTTAITEAFVNGIDRSVVVTVLDDSFDAGTYEHKSALESMGILWDGTERTYSYAEAYVGTPPVYHATIAGALSAAASGEAKTVYLYKNLAVNPVLPAGVSLNLGNYTLTGSVTAADGNVVGQAIVDGKTVYTSYANSVGETWTDGSGDHSWGNYANWSLGFVPVDTTAVTFNDGATVTLDANRTVAGIVVNGAVSIAASQKSLNTSGNITGSGTLTLSDVCLASASDSGISVAPAVHFTNDSELARVNSTCSGVTLNGAVTFSGAFKAWDVNHIVTGAVIINSGANFSNGNAWVHVNGAATVKGAFTAGNSKLKFSNALTIEAGGVTVNGSNVNLDSDTATIVLAGAGATLTDSRGEPIANNKVSTTVADSYVKKTGSTFAVAAKTVVTVSVGSNVSLTINGSAVADGDTLKFAPGDTFTYVATPAANYTANVAVTGGTDNDGTVTVGETAITVAATATHNGATVSNVAVSYGSDYTSAEVTATVSDATLDYYISWASGEPVKGTVSGSTVTFDVSGIAHSAPYQSSGYNISAKDGETTVTTTGGSGESVAADVAANWINENATTHGNAVAAGGVWTNAEAVTYSDGKAAITDNRFAATTASTSSRVVLEFEVCFSSASEETVSGDAQAAIKLGEDDSVTTFKVLTTGNAWMSVSNAELPIDPSETYKVVLTIDYGSNAYGVTVGNYVMTNSTGDTTFPLAKSGATSVQNIDFAGSGTLTSMKGDQVEGYMVVDKNGTRYPTIDAAIAAYNANPTIGPLKVLHAGTAPSGWKIDGNTLIKLAKGFFFMAY